MINEGLPDLVNGRIPIDGSGVTQPISAASLPIPAGAATEAKQDTGNSSLSSIDLKTPALVGGKVPVDGSGVVQPVSATALPLPTGASTSALQTSGNSILSSIDTKLTAPLSVTGPLTDSQLRASPVPVSASALPLPTGAATSALQTSGNSILSSIDLKLTAPISVSGPLTDAQLRATAVPVSAAALPLPSGASTAALQTTGNTSLASIDTKLTAPLAVTGPLTDTQLRASPVPISGTVTANQGGTWNINNITGTVPLPTGAATEATLSAINTKVPANPSTDRTIASAPFSNRLSDGTAFYDARQVRALTAADVVTANQGGAWTVTANAGTNLNTSALALEATQVTQSTRIGDLTEAAPASDTASSGLNGRLQRIAQRLTSLFIGQSDGTQRARITDGTNNAALSATDEVPEASQGLVVRNIPKVRETYSASINNLVPAATATDVFTLTGSATRTVYIHKITVTGTRTAHAHDLIQIIKRSTANTAGTSVVQTAVPYDSANAAATATARAYTANPTLGTAVGTMYAARQSIPVQTPANAQGNGGAVVPFEWTPSPGGQAGVLRGVAQVVAVNLNAITITGGILQITVEWSEE